ncbi:MAG: TraB/GumN family protein, partial [Pseudomonadota bacterium]
ELEKNIVALETIQEQIEVLENLSRENIFHFLENVDQWDVISAAYAQSYLQGDLEKIKTMGLRFPSRHSSVIDRRDQIFFERARGYLEEGDALLCVGAPHILGLRRLLTADGYSFRACHPQ